MSSKDERGREQEKAQRGEPAPIARQHAGSGDLRGASRACDRTARKRRRGCRRNSHANGAPRSERGSSAALRPARSRVRARSASTRLRRDDTVRSAASRTRSADSASRPRVRRAARSAAGKSSAVNESPRTRIVGPASSVSRTTSGVVSPESSLDLPLGGSSSSSTVSVARSSSPSMRKRSPPLRWVGGAERGPGIEPPVRMAVGLDDGVEGRQRAAAGPVGVVHQIDVSPVRAAITAGLRSTVFTPRSASD